MVPGKSCSSADELLSVRFPSATADLAVPECPFDNRHS